MKKGIAILLMSVLMLFVLYYNRSFYSNGSGQYFTLWKPFGEQSYLIKGKYFSPLKPRLNYAILYSSKHVYFCESCVDTITLNLGSDIIDKKGLHDFNFLNHSEFFKKYRDESFANGKLVKGKDFIRKKEKYKIKRIEL
ncbi:MAG: hypothetical protein AAGA77_17630 [Bacteroidota bacterium]